MISSRIHTDNRFDINYKIIINNIIKYNINIIDIMIQCYNEIIITIFNNT